MIIRQLENTSLYTDNRVIHYNYIPTTYPYTVTYKYILTESNTAFIPKWYPISNYRVGVKKRSYSFSYPEDFKIQ